jgi:probable HAF family extracellular repeat protein
MVGTAQLQTGPQRPVRWISPTQIEDLGVYGPFLLDGVNYFNATGDAVNDHGQIVGTTTSPARYSTAYRWTPGIGMELLGTLGGDTSAAGAINNRGDVVGYSTIANGDTHAFLWTESNGMIDLGTLPGANYFSASDVNDLRVVTGSYTTPAGVTRAFRWSAATGMVDIGGGAVGLQSVGLGINALGAITGTRGVPSGDTHAILWKPSGQRIDLSGNASDWAAGVDVNLFGVVAVSISTLADVPLIPSRAVIYRPPGYSASLVRAARRAYKCPASAAEHAS